jgi:hypothetical protein
MYGQDSAPGTPQNPQVINFPAGHPLAVGSLLPQFPQVAAAVDAFARRIPWWAWVAATFAATMWLQRQGHLRKIASSFGGR